MAFFTFTTVSGSAATNDLVIKVVNPLGNTSPTTLSLVNGFVAFTNIQGNTTVSEYTPSNFASGGIPQYTTNSAGTTGTTYITMSLSTYQTPGLAAKLLAAGDINATGATSAQIDDFISHHTNAANGSLNHATVNATQFGSLTNLLGTGGATSLDATDATSAQFAVIATNNTKVGAAAIDNAYLDPTQFGNITAVKFATDGATINAAGVTAGANTDTLINAMVAAAVQVAAVENVSIDNTNLANANFAAFVALAPLGITSVNGSAFTSANWTTLIADRTAVAVGAISNTGTALSVANFLAIPNKFADSGVSYIDLTGATSAQIDSMGANAVKLAVGSVNNATLTPAQFGALAVKVAAGEATVDATGATAAQVTTILQNLAAFSNSLSDLSIGANQFNTANLTALNTAVTAGTLSVTAQEATIINTGTGFKAVSITGSDGADNITVGNARNTVQGGMGKDIIVGGSVGSELRGGNAADTIIGGAGNDTIYGGKSLVAQQLTGNGGTDTYFLSAASVNTINDLISADVLNNDAGAVTLGLLTAASYQASATSVNNGALTVAVAAGDYNADLSTLSVASTAGVTISGSAGQNVLTGSSLADAISTADNAAGKEDTVNAGAGNDTITGSSGAGTAVLNGQAGNDSITGGSSVETISGGTGADTLTGGAGADKFVIDAAANDIITDLGNGVDIVVNAGTLTATTTANWTAATDVTHNLGLATINVGNGLNVSLVADTVAGGNGWTVTAANNATGSVIVGSAFADTITGSLGADSLSGSAGNDVIVANGGNDTLAGGTGSNTLTGGDGNDTYQTTGSDTIVGLATGDVLVASGSGVATAAGISAFVATTATNNTSSARSVLSAAAGVDAVINMALATGSAGYDITGGTGVDILTGSLNADSITGGDGADVLTGGAGVDTLVGGLGNDVFNVDVGNDSVVGLTTGDVLVVSAGVSAAVSAADVTAFVATANTLNFGGFTLNTASTASTVDLSLASGNTGFTVVGGAGADTITGTALADNLRGAAEIDVISGGAGNDTITGGTGADVMTGGLGVDVFAFASTSDTGLATAGAAATSTTTLDKMFVALGDQINLTGSVDTAASYAAFGTLVTTGSISNAVSAHVVQRVEGVYDATANTFTVGTSGANAVMLSWAATDAGTTATESVVLVGVTDVTSIASGVITV